MKKWMKWALGAFVLLIIIGAVAGGSESENNDSDSSGNQASETTTKKANASTSDDKKADEPDQCGFKATDDCTPRVTGRSKVQVDTIVYRVTGAESAAEIGDDTYGLGEKADGRFVSVDVSATNGKDESITLTDVFKLEIDGNTYEPDNDGTVAAIGAGDEPFFLKQIGPDVTSKGVVVFDVPASAIGKKMELRLNELGFGSTHAFIKLPALSR